VRGRLSSRYRAADGRPIGQVDLVEIDGSLARIHGWLAHPTGDSPAGFSLTGLERPVPLPPPTLDRPDVPEDEFGPGPHGFTVEVPTAIDVDGAAAVRLESARGTHSQRDPDVRVVPCFADLHAVSEGVLIGEVVGDRHLDLLNLGLRGNDTDLGLTLDAMNVDVIGPTGVSVTRQRFTVDVLRLIETAVRRGAMRPSPNVLIQLTSAGEVVAEGPYSLGVSIDSRLDAQGPPLVRGWAVTPGNRARALSLDLVVNGAVFASATTDIVRRDLLDKGISEGRGGYEFRLPILPSARAVSEWQVRLTATGHVLHEWTMAHLPGSDVSTSSVDVDPAVLQRIPPPAVVVPIYNAVEHVRACVASVLRNSPTDTRIILVDDASPDSAINAYLMSMVGNAQVQVLRNEINVGFTGSVNTGIKAADDADVVILNSDTMVTPGWLERLRAACYSADRIATATPLSNSAGAFSVPVVGQENNLPAHLTLDSYARLVSQVSARMRPLAPTGHGFCMYVRRAALDDVGLLDESRFARGYGEENDLCMRLVRNGWANVVDDATFVYHAQGQSFGAERAERILAARELLDEMYPEYRSLVADFVHGDQMTAIRFRISDALADLTLHDRRHVAYVTATQSGGTPQTNRDLMTGLQQSFRTFEFRFAKDGAATLLEWNGSSYRTLAQEQLPRQTLVRPRVPSHERFLLEWLARLQVEIVHFRHLAWMSSELPAAAKASGRRVVISLHDYFTICPSLKLLDENGHYCGGVCTPGGSGSPCGTLLYDARDIPPLKHSWVHQWRQLSQRALGAADALVVTSESAAELVEFHFPDVSAKVHIVEHGRDFEEVLAPRSAVNSGPLRVLLAGELSDAKGLRVLRRLSHLLKDSPVEFHLLGTAESPVHAPNFVEHGAYRREDFVALANDIGAAVGLIPAIWPETYSHTLTEMWAAGLPVLAFDCGAVSERISRHQGGWVVPLGDVAALARLIDALASNADEILDKQEALRRWQLHQQRTVRLMAHDYRNLYLPGPRGDGEPPVRVALVAPGASRKGATVSTHVRILSRLRGGESRGISFDYLDPATIMADGPIDFDVCLVQRNAVGSDVIDDFLAAIQRRRTPLLMDIDDDLLDVPSFIDVDGSYSEAAPAVAKALRAADLVTVSTREIAERYLGLANRIELVENRVDEALWLSHLPVAPRPTRSPGSPLRAVFMGQATHHEEFAFIEDLAATGADDGIEYTILGPSLSTVENIRILPSPARSYPEFVSWFRSLADGFDVALGPLMDSPFNRAKSALKFLDYSAVGLPGIYSRLRPFTEVVEDGANGLLVDNDVDAWREALLRLKHDVQARQEMGSRAHQTVRERHLLRPTISEWDGMIRALASTRKPQGVR
jgi:GT2 family glycosyltransferase/glycosyltransferase involved in cell wall biosynthesis